MGSCRQLPIRAWKRQLRSFWLQARHREPLASYAPRESDVDYVFFTSWLWAKHDDDPVNRARRQFIEVCRVRADLHFVGGFAPRRRGTPAGYAGLTAARRYPLAEYLAKTSRSALVFNTPAVHSCHGWKLGEYLALGKAIITTPLSRELPAPLVHGTHVHVVDGSRDELNAAITKLLEDLSYRRKLESAARAYWDEYLAPERSVARLIEVARANVTSRDPVTLGPPPAPVPQHDADKGGG
jgi:glycosyltransferase involved in cell wall biosynthesis